VEQCRDFTVTWALRVFSDSEELGLAFGCRTLSLQSPWWSSCHQKCSWTSGVDLVSLKSERYVFVVYIVETWEPTGLNFVCVQRMKSERKGNPPVPSLPLEVGPLKSS